MNHSHCFRVRRSLLRGAFVSVLAVALAVLPLAGETQEATPRTEGDVLLATTTSTADTGLLDALAPVFLDETGYTLKPIAVGSGAALELGEKGEADVLLVHSPAAEKAFMTEGFGVERRTVMYNDFVIVGPASDPAGLAGATGASDALQRIADSASPFVSRGDDSGTHALEKKLWASIDLEPDGSWYTEAGSGMGDTLNIANEREAYTISDRGTFLALKDRLDLGVLVEGDPALLNIYHVILTNPDNGQHIDTVGGEAFLDFLLEPSTQEFIGTFGVEEFGEPLFTPCADNSCGVEPEDVPAATPES